MRVGRLFLSLGPNLDDFLIESPLSVWLTTVAFSIVLPVNVLQWTITLKCCVNSVFPFPPSFYHLVEWQGLWNLFSCTFPIQASLNWPLVCFWLLFWDSSPAAPSFCPCPSILDAHFEHNSDISLSGAETRCWKRKSLCDNHISHRFSNECRQEILVSSVIVTSGGCLLNYTRNPFRIGEGEASFTYLNSLYLFQWFSTLFISRFI